MMTEYLLLSMRFVFYYTKHQSLFPHDSCYGKVSLFLLSCDSVCTFLKFPQFLIKFFTICFDCFDKRGQTPS